MLCEWLSIDKCWVGMVTPLSGTNKLFGYSADFVRLNESQLTPKNLYPFSPFCASIRGLQRPKLFGIAKEHKVRERLTLQAVDMAGKSGEEDHVVLSMVDVLEEDNALEEEANAVLGASDDQNCTYPQVFTSISAHLVVGLNVWCSES